MTLRPLLILPLLVTATATALSVGCVATPGNQNNHLNGDGSVTSPCQTKVCALGQHCELFATPCAPDSPACEPVAVCVADEVVDCGVMVDSGVEEQPCTPDDCGPQPPTLPCADESPSQACDREEHGTCGWRQLECPLIGEPCTGCEPCPIPEFGECQWTVVGVCSQVSADCV